MKIQNDLRWPDMKLGSSTFQTKKSITGEEDPVIEPQVAAPVFSDTTTEHNNPFYLTITATEGATIYYTLDGTEPTAESDLYESAILIDNQEDSWTIKAIAVIDDEVSNVTECTYVVTIPVPEPKNWHTYQTFVTEDEEDSVPTVAYDDETEEFTINPPGLGFGNWKIYYTLNSSTPPVPGQEGTLIYRVGGGIFVPNKSNHIIAVGIYEDDDECYKTNVSCTYVTHTEVTSVQIRSFETMYNNITFDTTLSDNEYEGIKENSNENEGQPDESYESGLGDFDPTPNVEVTYYTNIGNQPNKGWTLDGYPFAIPENVDRISIHYKVNSQSASDPDVNFIAMYNDDSDDYLTMKYSTQHTMFGSSNLYIVQDDNNLENSPTRTTESIYIKPNTDNILDIILGNNELYQIIHTKGDNKNKCDFNDSKSYNIFTINHSAIINKITLFIGEEVYGEITGNDENSMIYTNVDSEEEIIIPATLIQ